MRALWLTALLVACGGGSSGPLPPVELDVVVSRNGVSVHPRELHPVCTGDQWPTPGNCTPHSDAISCDDEMPPSSCNVRFALLAAAGGTIIESEDTLYHNVGLPSAVPGAATSLEIERCGQHASLVLPVAQGPPLQITGATRTETGVQLTWSGPADTTSVIYTWGNGFTGEGCHVPSAPELQVHQMSGWHATDFATLDIEAMRPAGVFETALGTVTIWTDLITSTPIWVPGQLDGNGWILSALGFDAEVTIDGSTSMHTFWSASADLLAVDPDSTVTITSDAFTYVAGPVDDTLSTGLNDPFVATFPHIVPTDGLAPGTPDDHYVLSIPEVTATRASDGATTQIALDIDWNLGLVARPIYP